jgi:UDP-N-acetylmuramoyl-L-alanyl-D-glutamate--2,6-diaminopimelate ligase
VLDALRELIESTTDVGRLIVVYGCGGDRDSTKRPLMGRAVAARAELAILTSDNPRGEDPAVIASEVLGGLGASDPKPIVELDRAIAIERAIAAARAGDIVVIAGKGHESGQTVGDITVPFDDRFVARDVLSRRGGGR